MKGSKLVLFVVIIFLNTTSIYSQAFSYALKNTKWIFGLGWNVAINNEIKDFKFDVTRNWNYLPYPSRFTMDGYITKGWSLQMELAYNTYKTGKYVDNDVLLKDHTFFSSDLNVLYHFDNLFKKNSWADPYLFIGYGYTYRTAVYNTSTATNNVGAGMNIWLYKGLGIGVQFQGKFALKGGVKSNYLLHSLSIAYKINKGKAKK